MSISAKNLNHVRVDRLETRIAALRMPYAQLLVARQVTNPGVDDLSESFCSLAESDGVVEIRHHFLLRCDC